MTSPATTNWPSLRVSDWTPTRETLHMWSQIVGKIRMAPMVNHWWQVPLYLTARGLTTSTMPYNSRIFQMDFDFLDHELQISTDWGASWLCPSKAYRWRISMGRPWPLYGLWG